MAGNACGMRLIVVYSDTTVFKFDAVTMAVSVMAAGRGRWGALSRMPHRRRR